jgi:diguanylate cyclase (GGDEF)-like protein
LNQYAFKITSHESASDLLFDFIIFSCIFYSTQLFIFESIDKVSEKNRQIYENTLLKQLMNKDALTNMQNRSAYVRYVEAQKQNPLSDSRKSFIFVMLDIDNFKKINDLQGHAAGDKVLQIVGSKITEYFAPLNCQSFRFGGDEFALLFEDITLEEAQRHIDTFTEELFRTTQLSLSYGCAAVDFQNENPFEAAYQKADAIMYGCKQQKKTTV